MAKGTMERREMLKLAGAGIPAAWLLTGRGGQAGAQDPNPLATRQQLRSETLARQIVATSAVRAAIAAALPVYFRTGAGDPGRGQ
jgi:hypothetical protein